VVLDGRLREPGESGSLLSTPEVEYTDALTGFEDERPRRHVRIGPREVASTLLR
jgi:hypothetical protein